MNQFWPRKHEGKFVEVGRGWERLLEKRYRNRHSLFFPGYSHHWKWYPELQQPSLNCEGIVWGIKPSAWNSVFHLTHSPTWLFLALQPPTRTSLPQEKNPHTSPMGPLFSLFTLLKAPKLCLWNTHHSLKLYMCKIIWPNLSLWLDYKLHKVKNPVFLAHHLTPAPHTMPDKSVAPYIVKWMNKQTLTFPKKDHAYFQTPPPEL